MALDYKLIGERLKKARNEKGLTQENIAEILDVSVAYLSRIETGKAQVNLKRLDELCSVLGVTNSYILEGASDKSATYLTGELNSILKDCTPDKKELIYQIATIISKENDKK